MTDGHGVHMLLSIFLPSEEIPLKQLELEFTNRVKFLIRSRSDRPAACYNNELIDDPLGTQ